MDSFVRIDKSEEEMVVDRSEDPQMKTNAAIVIADDDARSDQFPKVTTKVTDSSALIGEDDEGSPEHQAEFIEKLGSFYQEKAMEFKQPRFYGHPLNCLKLWRSVIKLGGYDQVTGKKIWRQVGDSFNPPKTCTNVSSTFRGFYEKLLLQYERHMTQIGELQLPIAPSPVDNEGSGYQISASGRAVRDSAARCRLGWQEQHFLAEPNVKDGSSYNTPKRAKSQKTSGSHERQNEEGQPMKAAKAKTSQPLDVQVVDVGPPANWVKINIRQTNDSFEVYALVPGLLQEEVRVQSDPAGRLVITGQPKQLDNFWGITAFKKVVTLPARIDQLRTHGDVTLHGCLHVHVPFEQKNL
ncbi:AT-rich interactive domain-containing protein 5-like [Solanum lycopersicum]|uniref:AT-rich interactive domain-containing protein 5-like n=2 Tax=Solanum lycopersicum TaxID=4081 RepID=UPI0037493EFD